MVQETVLPGKIANSAGIDRKRAILEKATELFAEQGFAGASIQDIADAAHTRKATVLYHFETKDALYAAVLDEALGRIAVVMGEFLAGGFGRDQLRERVAYLLDQIHAYFAEHLAHARLLERELLEVASPTAHLTAFVEQVYLPAVTSLEQAAEHGLIRGPVDPALFIHDLHVQLIGYFCHRPLLERLKPGDPFSVDALIARRNHLVDQIFRQLQVPDDAEPT